MRVLLDCRMATWSGIGRYCTGLTRALHRTSGVEIVQMIAEGSEPPVPDAEVIEAARHPFRLAGALEFGRIAARSAPDITHALHFPTPMPARHPLIVTVQDLTPLVVEGVMPSAIRRGAYRRSMARAVSAADRILTPSAFSASDVVRFFPGAAGRTTPVLLAADDFTSGPVGRLPEWLEESRFILSMGNTRPHKDLPTLLRAFATLDAQDVLLVLAGEDPGGYALSVLGDHPAAQRVHFSGPIDDETLRALFAGAEVLAVTSRYEGFGLPPLEAMSFGTPVVSSSAASLPEVVGDAALLVAPGDVEALRSALDRVLSDVDLAQRLVHIGRERALGFTWDTTAAGTVAVYRQALGV
ncbi:MAG: glycosyltransferase family 1 protein [Coriobacteriia bacterium]|jgi:alpha-1,3-rhamnosyl/mannosyltransferase